MRSGPVDVGRSFDVGAEEYDARFAEDPLTALRLRTIERPLYEAASRKGKVLDLGCGTGRVLAEIGARVRVGVDVSRGLLLEARRRGLVVVRGDAHALPFAAGAFDAVVSGNGVFAYLDTPRALSECARILAPGGLLVLHQYPIGDGEPDARVRYLQTLHEIRRPAASVGLTLQRAQVFRNLRFPPWLVRLPSWTPLRFASHVTVVLRKS